MKYNKILIANNKQYKVYFTDDSNERKKGLMELENIPNDWGILFHYDIADYYGIWMKNTKIPLDVVWINENKIIVDKKTLYPNVEIVSYPKNKSKYILEVNANTFVGKIGENISLENI
tara:strand:+ start:584 stop:937 length:354 start_codon:yes stop_codon:yes gene_type:complete